MCFFQRQKKATDAKRSSKIEPASDKASKNIFFVLGGPGSVSINIIDESLI